MQYYDKAAVGARIKKLRKSRNMTQSKLSECLDFTNERQLQRIENGETACSIDKLMEIAQILDSSTERYKPLTEKNKSRRFECRKHSLLHIPDCCTCIQAAFLEETILMMLNRELIQWGNAVKQKENLLSFQRAGIQTLKRKLELYRQESKQIQVQKGMFYEKYALGEIKEEIYRMSTAELTEQYASLSVKSENASVKLAELENEYQRSEEDMKQIIRYSHIEVLTQEIVDVFIQKVYVYKGKRVEIEWKFCGN